MKKLLKIMLIMSLLAFTSLACFNITSYAETAQPTAQAQETAAQSQEMTTTVESVSSADESFFNPQNIINIFLIAIGIVLILLAIAILSKMKNFK